MFLQQILLIVLLDMRWHSEYHTSFFVDSYHKGTKSLRGWCKEYSLCLGVLVVQNGKTGVSIFLNITFGAGLAAASPYVAFKMLTSERWRKGFSERLGKVPRREGDKPCIWIHGPSVGEILAAKPLHALIRERLPQYDIAISTTTPEGREQATKNYGGGPFLFPLDLTPYVKRTLDAVRPDCIVLIERDLWPNFLSVVYRRKIPVLVANGIVSESMVRRMGLLNRFSGGLATKRLLGRISAYCVQTPLYAERLGALGVAKGKICVTGNIKYDSLTASIPGEKLDSLRRLLCVEERDWLFVAGSTHAGEEKAALEAFGQLRGKYENVRLVLVPRHINRAEEVEKLVAEKGYARIRKTALDSGAFNREAIRNSVLIVDTMGDLLGLYAIASAAFVGGSITDRGGHNMLESAALGVATLFGPHVRNFQDSADLLLAADGAKTVRDGRELFVTLDFLRDNPVKSADMAARGREAVMKVRGATMKTFEKLEAVLAR